MITCFFLLVMGVIAFVGLDGVVPVGYSSVLLLLFVLIGGLTVVGVFIRCRTSEFVVTNKRVIFKTGFIRRNSLEVFLKNVGGMLVDQNIMGRIFDYGTVGVEGVAAKQRFNHIANPFALKRAIEEAIQKL